MDRFLAIFGGCCAPALGLILAVVSLLLNLAGRNRHGTVSLGLLAVTLSCFGATWVVYDLWPDGKVPLLSVGPMAGFALGAAAAGWGAARAAQRAEGDAPHGWPGWATTGAMLVVAVLTAAGCLAGFLLGGAYPDEVGGPFPDEASQRYRDRAGRHAGVLYGALGGLVLGALLAAAWLLLRWWRHRNRKPADGPFESIRQALLDLGLQLRVERGSWHLSRPGSQKELVLTPPPEGEVLSIDQLRRMLEERGMLGDDKGR